MKHKSGSTAALEEYIEAHVDELLQPDAYYEALATPVKPAAVIKKQHRHELAEFLKMDDLRSRLAKADKLIREHLPHQISPQAFAKIKQELDHSVENMISFATTLDLTSAKPISMQQIFGISDDSLIHIYELTQYLVHHKHYDDAIQILTFLTTMAPQISSFWLTFGICLQLLNQHESAIALFDIVKALHPTDPAPFIYSAESYVILHHINKAQHEIDLVKPLLEHSEKGPWQVSLDFVKQNLNDK